MNNKEDGFEIDNERLREVMLCVQQALTERRGIFKNGIKSFLPQWNLPESMEYEPQRTEVKDPFEAGLFLFISVAADKLNTSSFLQQRVLAGWNNENLRWLFYPENVAVHSALDVEGALKSLFSYTLPISKIKTAGEAYLENARVLVEEYNSDPRNLVRYKTVEESRRHIMRLSGWGTGLANLLMIEYSTRKIAVPTDQDNLRPKIDRHKARIPLNTNSIILRNHFKKQGRIHSDAVVAALEEVYVNAARREGLDLSEIDAALWVIGSEICYRNNINLCLSLCPLSKGLCKANTTLGRRNGYYQMYRPDGSRYDNRERKNQTMLSLEGQL